MKTMNQGGFKMKRYLACFSRWMLLSLILLGVLASPARAALPVYSIGTIPSQEVRQGSTLSFQIQSPRNSGTPVYSYSLEPGVALQGAINLDAASGLFTYKPAAADKFQFRVTFSSVITASPPDSQTVSIAPLSDLPPETEIIASSHAMPDPASTDYLQVTQSQNSGQKLFNTLQRTTWNIEISGKTVVFEENNLDHGGLYTRFNNRPDVENISIYAETLIIRSPLKLPGANVNIYVRHLRFEDTAQAASLDTTPLPYSIRADQAMDGAPGQNAGKVTLHIQDFFSQPGVFVRIIANGATGQDAGEGRAGAPKPDLSVSPPNAGNWGPGPYSMRWGSGVGRVVLDWPFFHQQWGWVLDQNGQPWPQNPTPYPGVIYVQCAPCGQYSAGQQIWPADGEDATPPGTPGLGGAGGVVSSNLLGVASFAQMSGGSSGNPGSAQPGGPPQNPVFSAWLRTIDGTRCQQDFFNFQVIATHQSVSGKSAPAVVAAQPKGPDGSFVLVADPSTLSWLHPYLLRHVLDHAKDTYRLGNLTDSKTILADYSGLLSQFTVFPDSYAADFSQMQNEMTGLLHRLASNLDYFGHTAGWVPLLSLQATMTAFSDEVAHAVPILFLARWLQAVADKNSADVTAMQEMMNQLSGDASAAAGNINAAQQGLPALQAEAAAINAELQNIEVMLQQRETELLLQAENDVEAQKQVPFWKKALRVIGTVAETVPAFQPALGTIGAGLNFVANFDVSQPLQSLQNAPDLTLLFKDDTWVASETNFNNFLKTVDFRSFSSAKDFAKELGDAYKGHQQLISQTIQQLQTTQISNADVQKEFAQLKAQDSRFNDLVQRVSDFQTRKQLFAQSVANTLQEIAQQQTTINKDLLSIGSLFQNVNSTVAQFDHGMMGYVMDIDRRTREHLMQYQYYMAKAYEYYMLQPYPGDLNIQSLIDEILTVMNIDGYAALSNQADQAAIKAVYLDSVRNIVSSALTQLQTRPPERSLPFFFRLTDEQLLQLNNTGQLVLDLVPLIQGLSNEDDRHLADLTVTNLTVGPCAATGPVARLRLLMIHQGESTERLNGHAYTFHFGNGPDDQPISWGGIFELPNGPWAQETLSVAGLSLLQSFLNISDPLDPRQAALSFFARPGADAVIKILLTEDPADLNCRITSLEMSATVDFFRSSTSQASLTVKANDAILPYIKLDHPDLTGRADGIGTFTRAYPLGEKVTLEAEPNYGSLIFKEWRDNSGNLLGTSTTLNSTLALSSTVQPIYTLTLSGRVVDGSNQPLSNVAVNLAGSQSASTITGADGGYRFDGLLPGSYTLIASAKGLSFTPAIASFTGISSTENVVFVAQPAACSFSIAPGGQAFDSSGGSGSITVTTAPDCSWTATSPDPAITITGGNSGRGSGTVSYSVAVNSSALPRITVLSVAGQTFTVTQSPAGSSALSLSASNLPFPSALAGTTGGSQSVTLLNSSKAIINVISIVLSGADSSSFAISGTSHCEPVILSGQGCAITVTFAPGTIGAKNAAVLINDDAAGNPQMISLSGSGAGYSIAVQSSASVASGQTIHLPLAITASAGYSNQASISCSGLPAGAVCTAIPQQVVVDPNVPVSATVTITAAGASAATVNSPSRPVPLPLTPAILACLMTPLAWFCLTQRKSGRVRLLAVQVGMITFLLLLSSCGGQPSSPPSRATGAPQGTYDLVIKATANDFEAKAIVKVTLQ
jgi:hypothetical protein